MVVENEENFSFLAIVQYAYALNIIKTNDERKFTSCAYNIKQNLMQE
jgi:hypothetical protein